MKTDTYTKFILSIIALSLTVIAFSNTSIINKAVASSSMSCTGVIKANAWGGIKESIGGYEVDVKCE